jgi:predicted nucleic acid-binding Zn ribbon protein
MKTCPSCSKEAPEDAKFCSYCGKTLDVRSLTAREIAAIQEELKDARRSSTGLLIGAVIFIVVGVFSNNGWAIAGFAMVGVCLLAGLFCENRVYQLKKELRGR